MASLSPSVVELAGAILFALAIVHTFSTKFFVHLAHSRPTHAGLWHLLGEIEVVFGFWAMIAILVICAADSVPQAVAFMDSRNFTEPAFVFVIMVIAASRPVLQAAEVAITGISRVLPLPSAGAFFVSVLIVGPLLGSFITEPAAMTLVALMLSDRIYRHDVSNQLKYATLGLLFVNVSIGGTLTHFAAPPVLMVAATWGWDTPFMLATFGWKAAVAVTVNTLVVAFWFRRELAALPGSAAEGRTRSPAPWPLVAVHLAFLAGVIVFNHHPRVFLALFLFFLGITEAYRRHQSRLIIREGLLVAFFLAGLVTLGGLQQWWLAPVLSGLDNLTLFVGATALTAITDNAALTYLGSLVQGVSDDYKYALVAGAVTGGGLTVIANAPNPAGFAILRKHFNDGAISPLGLLLAALPWTAVAAAMFMSFGLF